MAADRSQVSDGLYMTEEQYLALDEATAYDRASVVMTENALCRDAQEGMAAFVEKRRPTWTGE